MKLPRFTPVIKPNWRSAPRALRVTSVPLRLVPTPVPTETHRSREEQKLRSTARTVRKRKGRGTERKRKKRLPAELRNERDEFCSARLKLMS